MVSDGQRMSEVEVEEEDTGMSLYRVHPDEARPDASGERTSRWEYEGLVQRRCGRDERKHAQNEWPVDSETS